MRGTGRRVLAWLCVVACLVSGPPAGACGPFFPNMMLVQGDDAVFDAPVARFYAEIARAQARLNIPKPPHPFVESAIGAAPATPNADAADLAAALRQQGRGSNEITATVAAYTAAREAMTPKENTNAEAKAATPALPEGIPAEFADYFRGAVAWHSGNTNGARAAWQALLDRPRKERRFKSTWAAFMLARSFETEDPARSVSYYGLVREMAKDGFADSLGLAADSIGWEARTHLKAGHFTTAIEMYLQQLALDDQTAYASLSFTARNLLSAEPAALRSAATNSAAQAVVTAYLISSGRTWGWIEEPPTNNAAIWLDALERAGVSDAALAEQLALANYQTGRYELAQRWIRRAPKAPVSQWLQAKLLLREGKTDDAARLLAKIARLFPLHITSNSPNDSLAHNLTGDEAADLHEGTFIGMGAGRNVLGELGVLRLHRKEYSQALDALLNGGFWADAAYVAERVLTVNELKNYVDRHWPEIAVDTEEEKEAPENLRPSRQSRQIRYLLARRLARAERMADARPYFPEEWLASFDELMACLLVGQNEALANEQRATNYYRAAWIARTNGIELLGTELAPDYAIWGGNYEDGPTVQGRAANATNNLFGATGDELRRGAAHEVEPQHRWHYRGHAALLAYEAARLLPDNDPRTARALYSAGRWVQDLQTADRIYKQLVRRCRKTEIGKAADEWRWFPRLDANDKPLPSPRVKLTAANLTPVTRETPAVEDAVPMDAPPVTPEPERPEP